jgi:hypothetical protein
VKNDIFVDFDSFIVFHVDPFMIEGEDDGVEAVSGIISIVGMQACKVSLFYHSFSYQMNAVVVLLNVRP